MVATNYTLLGYFSLHLHLSIVKHHLEGAWHPLLFGETHHVVHICYSPDEH